MAVVITNGAGYPLYEYSHDGIFKDMKGNVISETEALSLNTNTNGNFYKFKKERAIFSWTSFAYGFILGLVLISILQQIL